jgi:hypothetical protein
MGPDRFRILAGRSVDDITVDSVVVNTLRVPREAFAALIESWGDGHSEAIGEHTGIRRERASESCHQMIANVRHPQGYTVWMVPVVRARLV